MASQSLLSAVAADGAGTGATVTGPATVHVSGASNFAGSRILVEVSVADTAANYTQVFDTEGEPLEFTRPGAATLNILGAYYVRLVVENANSTGATSLTATLDQ